VSAMVKPRTAATTFEVDLICIVCVYF
jgi:hypothetical protein